MFESELMYWLGEFVLFVAASLVGMLAILLVFLALCTAIFTVTGHLCWTGSLKREESFSFRQVLSDAFTGALGYSLQLAVVMVPMGLLVVVAAFVTTLLKFQR